MSTDTSHHTDPTFEIATFDTSDDQDDYADPEKLEIRHTALEEHLASIGALPLKQEVVIDSTDLYGPETFEEYRKRVSAAANLLRPNQGRDLTYSEQSRVDSLVNGRGYSESEAINSVVTGGVRAIYGDEEFDFRSPRALEFVGKILGERFTSHVTKYRGDIVRATLKDDKGASEISVEEMNELLRLMGLRKKNK